MHQSQPIGPTSSLTAALGARPLGPTALAALSTPELLTEVVVVGYGGAPWDELLRRLVPSTMRDLSGAISSGQIHGRWAAIGIAVPNNAALRLHLVPDEIASEAVEDTVDQLKGTLLSRGAWHPAGPRSLEEAFAGWCLKPAANAYRRAHTAKRREVPIDLRETEGAVLAGRWGESPDPADVIGQRERLQTLEALSNTYRGAVALEAAGWSQAEIAAHLGITPVALRARLRRGRRLLDERNSEGGPR